MLRMVNANIQHIRQKKKKGQHIFFVFQPYHHILNIRQNLNPLEGYIWSTIEKE